MSKRVADMTPAQHEWQLISDRIRRGANREKRQATNRIDATATDKRIFEWDRIWKREHPVLGPVKTAEDLRRVEALKEYAREKNRRRRAARGAKSFLGPVTPPAPACSAGDLAPVIVPLTVIEGERDRMVSVPVVVTYSEEGPVSVPIYKVQP